MTLNNLYTKIPIFNDNKVCVPYSQCPQKYYTIKLYQNVTLKCRNKLFRLLRFVPQTPVGTFPLDVAPSTEPYHFSSVAAPLFVPIETWLNYTVRRSYKIYNFTLTVFPQHKTNIFWSRLSHFLLLNSKHESVSYLRCLLPPPGRLFSSLFVCLLATLRQNFQTDMHKILRESWQ